MNIFKNYIQQHKGIYLYGAGINAKLLLKTMKEMGRIPKGFIVSHDASEAVIDGIPVFSWERAKKNISSKDGIILAVSEEWQSEIIPNLAGRDFFAFKDEEFCFLKGCSFQKTLQQLQKEVAPPQQISTEQWRNILVIRIDAVGDMVWTTPFLRELRRNVPKDAKITLIHNTRTTSLIEECPYIDRSIPIDVPLKTWDFDPNIESIKQKIRMFCQKIINAEQFDTVILPRFVMHGDSIEALLLSFYCGAPNRLIRQNNYEPYTEIYQKELNKLCSIVYTTIEPKHEVECMMDFLRFLGMNVVNDNLEIWAKNVMHSCFPMETDKIYVAVGLVAGSLKRNWPPAHYAMLFQKIEKKFVGKVMFILFGGKDACDARDDLSGSDVYKSSCVDLIGKTALSDVGSIMKCCSLYLGSDTGLMHIAAACGKPVVVLSPYSGVSAINEHSPVRCGPWKVKYVWLTPKDNSEYESRQVSVDCVYKAILEFLKEEMI